MCFLPSWGAPIQCRSGGSTGLVRELLGRKDADGRGGKGTRSVESTVEPRWNILDKGWCSSRESTQIFDATYLGNGPNSFL